MYAKLHSSSGNGDNSGGDYDSGNNCKVQIQGSSSPLSLPLNY